MFLKFMIVYDIYYFCKMGQVMLQYTWFVHAVKNIKTDAASLEGVMSG